MYNPTTTYNELQTREEIGDVNKFSINDSFMIWEVINHKRNY